MGVGVSVGDGVTVDVGVLVGRKTGRDALGKLHGRIIISKTQMGRYFRLMDKITISRLIDALNWSYVQLISSPIFQNLLLQQEIPALQQPIQNHLQ